MRGTRRLYFARAAVQSRHASSTSHVGNRISTKQNLPPLSSNIPQVDYIGSTRHVTNLFVRLTKIIFVGGLTIATAGAVSFEGLHQWVESGPLSTPSRGDDEFGWEDEVQGWTGGQRGGTDPRLGWKARHAVRAAWMCQTWGAGDTSVTNSRQGIFEPDYFALRGMIGVDPTVVRPDRGYELAAAFISAALETARVKGFAFPPTLSSLRRAGPPETNAKTTEGDPTVVDLLLLRAGALERVGSADSLHEAKEIYERVVAAIHSDADPLREARIMRLASRVGSLCARMGDGQEAMEWWGWGLRRVGIDLPSGTEQTARSWVKAPKIEQTLPALPAPTLRAAITLLANASTHLAITSHLAAASQLQTTALALLPAPRPIPRPDLTTAGLVLHHTWLEHRSALLSLHLASTTYAQGRPALNIATTAASRADNILEAIEPIPSAYTGALRPASLLLRRDALLTAAEAAYTRGLLLERQPSPNLETIAELYERAMTLDAAESGRTESGAMGAEWEKYYASFARVKGKLGQSVQ